MKTMKWVLLSTVLVSLAQGQDLVKPDRLNLDVEVCEIPCVGKARKIKVELAEVRIRIGHQAPLPIGNFDELHFNAEFADVNRRKSHGTYRLSSDYILTKMDPLPPPDGSVGLYGGRSVLSRDGKTQLLLEYGAVSSADLVPEFRVQDLAEDRSPRPRQVVGLAQSHERDLGNARPPYAAPLGEKKFLVARSRVAYGASQGYELLLIDYDVVARTVGLISNNEEIHLRQNDGGAFVMMARYVPEPESHLYSGYQLDLDGNIVWRLKKDEKFVGASLTTIVKQRNMGNAVEVQWLKTSGESIAKKSFPQALVGEPLPYLPSPIFSDGSVVILPKQEALSKTVILNPSGADLSVEAKATDKVWGKMFPEEFAEKPHFLISEDRLWIYYQGILADKSDYITNIGSVSLKELRLK